MSIEELEPQFAAAFTEWERRYREEPERFISEAQKLLQGTPESYGEACAPYFLTILREQKESKSMSGILRCKLRVSEVLNRIAADGSIQSQQVKLSAVTSSDPNSENASFSKWTPSANFDIQITNPDAMNKLASGHEFYVDFIPAKQND